MSFVGMVFLLIVIGVALYIFNRRIPMDPDIKLLINVVIILGTLYWFLTWAGWSSMPMFRTR